MDFKNNFKKASILNTRFIAFMLGLSSLISLNAFCNQGKVGYGSSTSSLTSKNQENIFMAFELGLIETMGAERTNKVLVRNQDNSGSKIGAIKSATELMAQDVSALFGFSGSHDSVLVGKLVASKKILTIVPGSMHNDLATFGDTFFTTGHSMDLEVENTLSFIERKFPNSKGAVIINRYAVPSASAEKILLEKYSNTKWGDLKKFHINKDLYLSESDLKHLKLSHFDFIYITAYPEAMINVVNQLEKSNIDIPIVAASSWGLGDADLLRRFIINKKAPLYFSSDWIIHSEESKHFTNIFKRKFGREPSPENALGYDLGRIAGDTIKRIDGPITKESILLAFKKDLCFDRLSVGRLCFRKEGGHSNIKPRFYQFGSEKSLLVQ